MEWWVFLSTFFLGLTGLMLIGLPVAFAFLAVNMIGVYLLWGGFNGFNQLVLSIDSSISTFILVPIPMFILMGSVMFHAGIAERMIRVIDQWLGFISGRLAVLTVGAGAVLSTLTGVAMGSVAMLGGTLTPEMERRGYARTLAIGPVLGSGALAILIPPSTLAIVLASVGGFSVAKMLIAIILPGILLAIMYVIYILIRVKLRPQDAPAYEVPSVPLSVKLRDTALYLVPPVMVVVMIVVCIFTGLATPTESAAIGTFITFFLAAAYGDLSLAKLKHALLSSTKLSVMILIIMTGSASFSQLLSFSGATGAITTWATALDVSSITLMLMMMALVLIVGMFIEQTSIVLITMPIFLPIIGAMGWDPIWFAVVMMVNLELATITPPAGLSLFVMKGVAVPGTTMGQIYRAALPFILINILLMLILILWPALALWLPSLM
ncbi:TRAP transporter large permease [Xinfangfangia pollutisoli]|uniref:TRAP transporter large permease n=1 Tax=Xinfangfangia pollutisoli TaxID=2865960 RepID=UPI001CD66097|nr:TRAP transporter large permease subunit [Xinfangfangia pollutisoli]